jgi:hypothetical protein
MSDRDTNNEPLFQKMDEQERIYAPQEVPGEQIVAEERDRGSDAGESVAETERGDEPAVPAVGVVPGAAGITGSSGGTAGTVGAPVLPVVPVRDELDADEDREARREDERGR